MPSSGRTSERRVGGDHRAEALAGMQSAARPVRDPRCALAASLVVTITAVSASPLLWVVWVGCAAVLAAWWIAARVPVGWALRRWALVAPPVLVAAAVIPLTRPGQPVGSLGPVSVTREGLWAAVELATVASIGALSAVLLAGTVGATALVAALSGLGAPRLIVAIAQAMVGQIGIVQGQLWRMRTALQARGYRPSHLFAVAPLGRMGGALFVRTHDRAERVHMAMLARGHQPGRPHGPPLGRPAVADIAALAAVVVALVPLRLIAG